MRALFFLLVLVGCQTNKIKMDSVQRGNWKARALIKDKEHSRSYIVNLDINAIRGDKLRIDVTSPIGTQVAALVTTATEVRYYTTDAKKFFVGSPRPEALRPILSVPLDPRWLQNLVFDEAISAPGWTCVTGSDHLVSECRDSATDVALTWNNRTSANRSITIAHAKAEIQMNFRSYSPKLESAGNIFDLQAPKNYQLQKLRD